MADKYASFSELEKHEEQGNAYRVGATERPDSPVLIVAPHGGNIEVGTSELAALIAGSEYSLFSFEGLKPRGQNRDLHITSHRFDHPCCLALLSRHAVTIGIHGCKGESQIYIGGLDAELKTLLATNLAASGFPASAEGHRYPGSNPLNICNRGARKRGAQLEITMDLRAPAARGPIAAVIRTAIDEYLTVISAEMSHDHAAAR
jgi:phage replication-related protein YjqB (UPF0714/DUF867 family)